MRQDYEIVGSYDNQRVTTISAARTVNMFEYLDPDGKRPKVMLPTSGLVNANLDLGSETGGARGAFVFDGAIYQVYGGSVYRTTGSTNFLFTAKIGSLTTSAGYVGIDANQTQVIFVDGVQGYIWDDSTQIFVQITDPAFPGMPLDVCYLDGFFLVAHGDTNQFQLSMLNQGLVWGPDTTGPAPAGFTELTTTSGNPSIQLGFVGTFSIANYQAGTPVVVSNFSAPIPGFTTGNTYYVVKIIDATHFELSATNGGMPITPGATQNMRITNNGQLQQGAITSHPGTIVGCRTLHRRIFLFSQSFTEVWENAGIGTNLPFRRNNSLLMEVGTPALGSIRVGFDRMFFLAQDKDGLAGVMEVKGTESNLVSNRALDFQLAQYAADPLTGVQDAVGILIKENGLIFYRLNFTFANHTFVLNVTMSSIGGQDGDNLMWHEEEVLNYDRHPAQTHAYFDGNNYYGAYNKPVMYRVDSSVSTNDGEAIRRMRIGKQMSPEGYNRLRVDRFQLDLLQGAVEQIMLDPAFLLTEDSQDILTEDMNIGHPDEPLLLEQQVIGNGVQPIVFLSISKDGGQSYGYEVHGTMGKIGERTHRTVWRKLGTTPRGQGFTPRIQFFNQIPFVVLGAMWDFEDMPE
jgi:hypothetical protein